MPGRVRTRRQFAEFAHPTSRGSSGPLRVSFVVSEGVGVNVAYAISRRTGSAVVRNRLRRQLRSLFDERIDRLGQGFYLVRVEGLGKDLTYDELRVHLQHSLRRVDGN